MMLPPRVGSGSAFIYVFGDQYERELLYLDKLISPGESFLDGGANIGIYTLAASKLVGNSGVVIAVEPASDTFEKLAENIARNNLTNVHRVRAALSNVNGNTKLHHVQKKAASYSIVQERRFDLGETFEDVETVTIDSLLSEKGLSRLDLMKLDIEGAERLALGGATDLLRSAKPPKIIYEALNLDIEEHDKARSVWHFLSGFGYSFFCFSDSGDLCPLSRPDGPNLIAIPPRS